MSELETDQQNVALLVVDMQEAFLNSMDRGAKVLGRCRFAVEAASLLGFPIYFTEQVPEKLGHTCSELLHLGDFRETTFSKSSFSVRGAKGLFPSFSERGIQHVFLVGVETSICIYLSVLDLLGEGFGVTLFTDCIACRRPEDGEAVLSFLQQRTEVNLLPAESVFFSVIRDASSPNFKAFSKLVIAANREESTDE